MALLDYRDADRQDFFANIQGNILKGHGRNKTNNIFIKFRESKGEEARNWLSSMAAFVTSSHRQMWERERFKSAGEPGEIFYNLLLTAEGYRYLGFDPDKANMSKAFCDGMRSREELNDRISDFEKPFTETIHALLLLADDNESRLAEHANARITTIKDFAEVLTVEYGNVIRNPEGEGIEHFGYVDGISQPLFFVDEYEEFLKRNNGAKEYDPAADASTVLESDPFTTAGENRFGSYFVFRKLEQDVRTFKEKEKELAKTLNLDKNNEELAGAMLVGRFEDGTPVTVSQYEGVPDAENLNNFNYSKDGDGAKCPFHGHIRKTNSRGKLKDDAPRIARRGIPYGIRNVPTEIPHEPSQMPTGGVGLLFMCFQRSIEDQFEKIQISANSLKYGLDPIIGQDGKDNQSTGEFAKKYGDRTSLTSCPFKVFVTMKGGEYFFAPSISFFKNLK